MSTDRSPFFPTLADLSPQTRWWVEVLRGPRWYEHVDIHPLPMRKMSWRYRLRNWLTLAELADMCGTSTVYEHVVEAVHLPTGYQTGQHGGLSRRAAEDSAVHEIVQHLVQADLSARGVA